MGNSKAISQGACPFCDSSDAFTLYDDGHGYCFSCGGYQHADKNNTETTAPVGGISQHIVERNISKETAKKYGVTVKSVDTDYYSHDYKYYDENNSYVASKIRRVKDKAFSCTGNLSQAVLFGQQAFKSGGKYVTLCEGEIDAMSVHQMLGNKYACVSIKSGVKGAVKDVKSSFEFLDGFDKIVICFDNDQYGKEASEKVAQIFSPKKCKIVSLNLKDASDYLKQNKTQEFVKSWWDAEPYTPAGIINLGSLGEDLFKEEEVETCLYPWTDLNEYTYGMRSKELVTFTSGAGMGKSSVMRELMHHLLINTEDNIGVLALEESIKTTAYSIMSVCANQRLYIKEIREKFSSEQLKEWQDKTINTNRIFAFDHFGSMGNDEILSKVEHLASAKDCKWIIIDHLSILVSGQEVDDERKSIDILMTKLRKLVEQTKVGMLLVSHLRRPSGDRDFNNGREVSLGHLRGSASIAQLSDSVIALERDQQADDPSLANVVKVRVLKNRYCGTLGVACHLFYNKETGRIKQIQNPYSQTNDLSSTFDQAF